MAFVLQWIPRVAGMELGNPSINHRWPKNHRICNNNIADSCKQQPGLFPPPNPDFHKRRCVWSDTQCHECLEQSPPPLIHTHLFQSFGDKANSREKEKIPGKKIRNASSYRTKLLKASWNFLQQINAFPSVSFPI